MAFGDFSHDGRYAHNNVLLCRDENSSEKLSKGLASVRALRNDGDEELWNIVRKHMEMLTACPVSRKMRYDEFDDMEEDDFDEDDDDDMDQMMPDGWDLGDALGLDSDDSDAM